MTTQENLQREIDLYVSRTPRSRELQANAKKYLPGGAKLKIGEKRIHLTL